MFVYCMQALHLSEAEAYRRITVARAARRHAVLLAMLRDGRIHMSGMALLVPVLTSQNCDVVLERATHKSKRQIEQLVAELAPRPDVPSVMRKLPGPRPAPSSGAADGAGESFGWAPELVPGRVAASTAPRLVTGTAGSPASAVLRRAVVEPLSPGRYKVQFTASAELHDQLERLAALMRSEVPDGDIAAIIGRAVAEKLERLEARRFAKTATPRKTTPRKAVSRGDSSGPSRHIPAAVRRAVRARDAERCRFVDEQGRRCPERKRLEFHHRRPYGMGGDHSPENISLLCPAHNRYLAELDYGKAAVKGREISREETPRAPASA
jgi:hypothetical protein